MVALLNRTMIEKARELKGWEDLPVCHTVMMANGTVVYANQSLWGVSREEWIGQNFTLFLPDDALPLFNRSRMRALSNPGQPVRWGVQLLTNEGMASFNDELSYCSETKRLTNIGLLVGLE